MNNISNAYTEVLVILRNLKDGYHSVPMNKIKKMKKECNLNHKFKLQPNLPLKEQELLDETKAILSVLYCNYWASIEQKEIIKQKEKYDLKVLEKEKEGKYNTLNLFKKK